MKECFGNIFKRTVCNNYYNCKFSTDCLTETNIIKGVCNCEYKASCHLSRQKFQLKLRNNNETNKDCDFYQALKEMYTKHKKND